MHSSSLASIAMETTTNAGSATAMSDAVETLTCWLSQALCGGNALRGVELDTRRALLPQFHAMSMVLLWILAYAAKFFLALLPSMVPVPVLTSTLKKLSTLAEEYDAYGSVIEEERSRGLRPADFSRSPIARALTQVLALVNDVPASSNKYEFLQDLADRVIEENKVQGVKFNSVNKAALRRGFSRTIGLLGQSLESRQQRHSFLGRVVRHLPSSALLPSVALPAQFVKIRSLIRSILFPWSLWIPSSNLSEATPLPNLADTDMAEKFAKELLWMAKKMQNCGGMEEAVQQWSSVPSLASLSLCASPKVQKSLVRLSALLCNGLVGNTNIPQEVCLQLVLLWLPLLCNATHGGDSPIFNAEEKREAEKQLERLVAALPETDQEQVLSTWLQEYAMSQSDFPNLQKCYDTWYHSMRKLGVGMPKVIDE